MSNWEFFWEHYSPSIYKLWFPVIKLIDNPTPDFEGCLEPIAVFIQNKETHLPEIIILRGHNCFGVRLHEYGHWFLWRSYIAVDALWEFFWWGLSLRNLFIKKGK